MASKSDEVDLIVAGIVRKIAKGSRTRADILRYIPEHLIKHGKTQRRTAEAAMRLGSRFAGRGRHGLAAYALVLALTLDSDRLRRAERSQIMCASDPMRASRRGVLACLRDLGSAFLAELNPALPDRLTSYEAIEELAAAVRPFDQRYSALLRNRPPGVAKSLIALADMAFLSWRRGNDFPDKLRAVLARPTRMEFADPEDVASIASMCIADMASFGSFSSLECHAEVAPVVVTSTFVDLLELAWLRWHVLDYARQVCLLGFELRKVERAAGRVFVLQAADPHIEKAYRNAFIRQELAGNRRHPSYATEKDHVSMQSIAEALVARGKWYELRTEPYTRYAIRMLDPTSDEFDQILNKGAFWDDHALALEHEDWIVSAEAFRGASIAPDLTVDEFLRGARALRLFCELHAASLRDAAPTDPFVLWNSLIPVVPDAVLQNLMHWSGLSSKKQSTVIELLTWTGERFYDIQYQPFLG